MGIPSPFARSAGLEAWLKAQSIHNSGRTVLVLLFSRLSVSHLAGMGLIFIVIERPLRLVTVSSLSLDVGDLLWVGSRVLLWMVFNS